MNGKPLIEDRPDLTLDPGQLDPGLDITELSLNKGVFGIGEGSLGIDDITVVGDTLLKADPGEFEFTLVEGNDAAGEVDLAGPGIEVLEDEAVIAFDLLGEIAEFEFLAAEVGGGEACLRAEAETLKNGDGEPETDGPLFLHVVGP